MKKILLGLSVLLATTAGFAQGQSTIVTYDFNSGIPAGWSQTAADATSDGWKAGTNTTLSSQYWTIPTRSTGIVASNDDGCSNCNKSNDLLITDTIDLSSYSYVHATFESFYYGATWSNATESAKLKYSTNNGTTWIDAGDLVPGNDWTTQLFDVSGAAGSSNAQFAVFYGDGGGWLYGCAIDDFTLFVPYNYDMAATAYTGYSLVGLNNAPVTISGEISNLGGATITSMNVNYRINGGTVQTDQLSGLNVTPYSSYSFNHSTTWSPTTTGSYTIEIWASALNGTFDQVTSNDTISIEVDVVPATTDRVVLAEEFTSSTCAPCASFNPGYKAFLDANNANTATGRITSVKYQMNWPAPGNDPNYNAQADSRKTFYGINGVPDVVMSGFNIPTSQANFEIVRDLPAIADITATWGNTGNWVRCDVEVEALSDLGSNARLFIALIEKSISHTQATNGESTFYHVFRTFMGETAGKPLGTMNANDVSNVYEMKQISVSSAPQQGSYDFWVGTSNMDVVVWVQDQLTGEVLQSALAAYSTSSTDEMEVNAKYISLYPNPANANAGVELELLQTSEVEIHVVNTLGQTVIAQSQTLEAGVQQVALSTAELSAGLYFVNVNVNGASKTLRLNVAH